MKKCFPSRWAIRKLEERIVYGGMVDSDHKTDHRDSKNDSTEVLTDQQLSFTPEGEYLRADRVMIESETERKEKAESADVVTKDTKQSYAKFLKRKQEKKQKLEENEEITSQSSEKKERLVSKKQRRIAEKIDSVSLKEEVPDKKFVHNSISLQNSTLFQKFEQREFLIREEKLREMQREDENVMAKKRREKILRVIEEEDSYRFKLNQLSEESRIENTYQERGRILEVPKEAELELMFEMLLSQLKRLGFNERELNNLANQEEKKRELSKLVNKILEPKLYGRGFYKLASQKIMCERLIDLLKKHSINYVE